MAKQRVVNTFFWNDPFILRLRPDEKFLFLYVLTNPHTDLCGAYQVAMDTIIFETKLAEKRIKEILVKFELAGKVFYRDDWMIVKNFAKHQVSNPKVSKGIERSLNACPDWVKDTLSKGIIAYDSLSHSYSYLKGKPKPEPQPVRDVWVNGEKRTAEKPHSLPTSSEKEINVWLDAVAPITGAKNRTTLANPKAWREAVEKAMRDGRGIDEFLQATEAEALRNKSTPQFFTPTNVLKVVQAKVMKTDKWANG